MICAWMETSSAVVGSSAMISFGLPQARGRSRRAAACRRKNGADSDRCAAPAPGCRPPRAGPGALRRGRGWRRVEMRLDRLDELASDGVERIERGQRVLEHGADLASANAPHRLRRQVVDAPAVEDVSRPPAMRPGGSMKPMIAAPVSDLPAPDSPTTPSTSPPRSRTRHRRPRPACLDASEIRREDVRRQQRIVVERRRSGGPRSAIHCGSRGLRSVPAISRQSPYNRR